MIWCSAVLVALLVVVAQAAASTLRQRIVATAEQELGYHDYRDYCTKFGPCEYWCSLFLTWVWQQAGVPVPSLAFAGYLYDWAKATTAVRSGRGVPSPGDAVLYGTGPSSVSTSLHVGVVEAVYRGYLVTIEGDVVHGVRRFVVPMRNPQLIGEPAPIYAYASPIGSSTAAYAANAGSAARFPVLPAAVIARQQSVPATSPQKRRLLNTIAALRAFQHMPYATANVRIDWTGVDSQGRVNVRVGTAQSTSYAQSAWQGFLHQFNDAGHAYSVSLQRSAAVPIDSSAPSIAGTAGSPLRGQTLTESHGTWSNSPTAYSYQWEDCDSSGASCATISGATSQTYTVSSTDAGQTIRVQEVATNANGAGQPATSAATAIVAGPSLSPGSSVPPPAATGGSSPIGP